MTTLSDGLQNQVISVLQQLQAQAPDVYAQEIQYGILMHLGNAALFLAPIIVMIVTGRLLWAHCFREEKLNKGYLEEDFLYACRYAILGLFLLVGTLLFFWVGSEILEALKAACFPKAYAFDLLASHL
jgi:hypothetical protein